MAKDFKVRRAQAQPLTRCISEIQENRALLSELTLARRAGAAIVDVLAPFRLAVDFNDPAHCRVEDRTLVLLVHEASQQNRLRQLTPRLCATLAAKGLPLTGVTVRMVARPTQERHDNPAAKSTPREKSALGAAVIGHALDTIQDDKLRHSLARLRDAIAPIEGDRRALIEQRFGEESIERVNDNWKQSTAVKDLTYGIDSIGIPDAGQVENHPALKAVRDRLIARRDALCVKREAARARIQANNERLDAIDRGMHLLEDGDIDGAEALLIKPLEDHIPDTAPTGLPPARPSLKGSMAVKALSRGIKNYALKQTLNRLAGAMAPEGENYTDTLRAALEREVATLSAQLHLPGQKKTALKERISQIYQALEALDQPQADPHAIAEKIYQDTRPA